MSKRPFALSLPVNYLSCSSAMRRLVREEYVRLQEGKCQHCDKALNGAPRHDVVHSKINLDLFPPYFLSHPVHLHHDHYSGMTIGAVHARCNAWLWQYKGE